MIDTARPFRETVAKLVGDGITRHVNGVTSMRHNRTAIATVARQVAEEIETAVAVEHDGLQRVIDDQDARLIAQAKRIAWLEDDHARDGRLIDRYREETEKLRARVESITAERDHAEEQVHKIRMLKFWTNEDRKDFFFAADVWDITDPGRHGRPVEELAPCCDGKTRRCDTCGGHWGDGEPMRPCPYTCTHGEPCAYPEPRAWHAHDHGHLYTNDCTWSTQAAEQNPHARCSHVEQHHPHRWGQPAHWCDGTPTTIPAVPETQETTP